MVSRTKEIEKNAHADVARDKWLAKWNKQKIKNLKDGHVGLLAGVLMWMWPGMCWWGWERVCFLAGMLMWPGTCLPLANMLAWPWTHLLAHGCISLWADMQMCLLTYGHICLQLDMLMWLGCDCLPTDALISLQTDTLGSVWLWTKKKVNKELMCWSVDVEMIHRRKIKLASIYIQ